MNKETVLVVDDVEMNRIILEDILENHYHIEHASNGIEAISCLFSAAVMPSIVLLDIMMPEMDGFEVLELMKNNPLTQKTPVIFITAADASTNESKGLSMGAVDYIPKPFDPEVVKVRVSNQIKLKNYSDKLERMVEDKVEELVKTKEKILETLANIIEYRNLESGHHVRRSSELTKLLVRHMVRKPVFEKQLADMDIDIISKAVQLHDVGKIASPDRILLKPGPLEKAEFEIIKSHSTVGSDIIRSLIECDDDLYLNYSYDICRHHHERWDGTGYPDKLRANDIPVAARILSVVDVYDALVSKRVYKLPFSHEQSMRIIVDGSGTQFDPEIVTALVELNEQFANFSVR